MINFVDSDIFIVSYPRSGNTWVRTIISEIVFKHSGKKLGDLCKFIPDLHTPNIDNIILKHPRIFKSHFNYSDEYKRVIYIVRDPRDVFISYYKYLTQKKKYDATLNNFIIDVRESNYLTS